MQPPGQDVQALSARLHKDPRAVHVLEILHRFPGYQPAARQTRELPVESLRRARGGGPQVPVPDVAPQRGRGVHRVPDGPRETADPRADREPRLPRVLPGATATADESSASTARTTGHLRLRERLLLRSSDTHRVLHVHLQLVDGVLVVMRHRRQCHRHYHRYDRHRHGHRRPRYLYDLRGRPRNYRRTSAHRPTTRTSSLRSSST